MIKKRIRIDTAAYKLLLSRQMPGESMSATIKRLIPITPKPKRPSRKRFDVNKWLKIVEQNQLSEETVEGIEWAIKNRHRGAGFEATERVNLCQYTSSCVPIVSRSTAGFPSYCTKRNTSRRS